MGSKSKGWASPLEHIFYGVLWNSRNTFKSENFASGIVRVLYCVKTRKIRRRHRITMSFRV